MRRDVATGMIRPLNLAVVLLFAACVEHAQACGTAGAGQRVFPVCEISAPRSDERTAVVYVNSGSGLSSVTPGSDGIVTEVVDVEIGVADKPHYIVLSSGKPIIWRFTGRIDAISRVVVLGSQFNGATRSGVIGVPRDRIEFAKTDVEKLKSRMPGRSTCDSFSWACEASVYFDIPKRRIDLAGDEPPARHAVDQFVERIRGDVIRIPQDGWIYEWSGFEFYTETSQTHERGLIRIDPASVVSPETVRDYAVLPGAAGIRQLVADGSLIGPDDARFKAAYDKWNERLDQPYRNRYHVDYLTTRPMTLPAALDRTAFLIGEGVEPPDLNGNWYGILFYFADFRKIKVELRKSGDPR
jgi:hypothetical protein